MEGSVLTAVLYPVFPFSLWKAVTVFPICKPYIFCRPDLLNTEIIITAILKPLIFLPKSVGTYEGMLQRLRKHNHHKPYRCPQNKLSRQQLLQMRQPYQQPIKSYGGDLGVQKTNWSSYHNRMVICGYPIIQRIRAMSAPCVYRRKAIMWLNNRTIGQRQERSEWSSLLAKIFTLYQQV